MTLLGAISDHLDNGDSNGAIALRGLLGTGKVWSDRAPDKKSMPYVVVREISTTPLSQNVTHESRIDSARGQIDCFARSGALVDQVLDLVEDIFDGPDRVTLTVSDRTHLTTAFLNRLHVQDPDDAVFHGFVELQFILVKS